MRTEKPINAVFWFFIKGKKIDLNLIRNSGPALFSIFINEDVIANAGVI